MRTQTLQGSSRRPWGGPQHISWFLGLLLLLAATTMVVLGCEKETTLIEPPKFFEFDPANAWRECTEGASPVPDRGFIPPPPGIFLEVCPNPAPAGTETMTFRFELEVVVPSVNLGIIDDRGRIVRRLIVNQSFDTDVVHEINWLIRDVPPGDYRAYFRAGALESNSDLRIES